jgi:hypothetical protein
MSAGESDYIVNLPLAYLEPGAHLLPIEAKTRLEVAS